MGRDTLSDEHLIGTVAGVMKSRAVRRLQEPARWVPAALNAMLFPPWLPHLNLSGDQHTKSPSRLELCQDSSRFQQLQPHGIRSQRRFVTTPSDAEQTTKRQRQEVIPKESQQVSSSSCAATDTSMQIPDPQILKPARPLSPVERGREYPKTSETSKNQHSVNNCRSTQRKRDRNIDGCSECIAHCESE